MKNPEQIERTFLAIYIIISNTWKLLVFDQKNL